VDDLQERIQATINLFFESPHEKNVAYLALKPETEFTREDRIRLKIIEKDDNTLMLDISTSDLTSFRAVVNSYFRWLKIIEDTHSFVKKNIE